MEEKFLDSNINKDIYDTEVIMGSTPGGNLTLINIEKLCVL